MQHTCNVKAVEEPELNAHTHTRRHIGGDGAISKSLSTPAGGTAVLAGGNVTDMALLEIRQGHSVVLTWQKVVRNSESGYIHIMHCII